MAKLTKIYTRTGDGGTTRLGDGSETAKDCARVEAYGAVDELNAHIGQVLTTGVCDRLGEVLAGVQNRLFDLGADLATPATETVAFPVPRIEADHVVDLERLIDELNETLGPLQNFILPGGDPGAAGLHVARTVCRRAERRLITLSRKEDVGEHVVPYLNRLSDALFVMARFENHRAGAGELLWEPGR
jgi:cob(I)alamin adenosyltransferase